VDTLGLLLAAHVILANEQERAQVKDKELAQAVQEMTQHSVEVAFVDQGYTGNDPKNDAKDFDIQLIMVKLSEPRKGFVLLQRRWVVERSFAWNSRFRRLARDFEKNA
jgi:transposase